jgi:REP element-mobilizing transposase RayT
MTKWNQRRRAAKHEAHVDGGPQWYSRGYLPHFDEEGLTQTLVFRLVDSMPQELLDFWREELRLVPTREANRERRERIDAYLDQGHGSCYLRDDRLAEIVQNALLHFDNQRYRLHAWVVMPNHVHTLYTAEPGWELSQIAHSWKSYTASECNRVLARKGEFWQREPFDRYIRNQRHFANALRYIEENPVKAGLCKKAEDWRWSSAARVDGAQESLLTSIGITDRL